MIGQVTNPKKGVNYYVTPEVEMVELEANSSFLNGVVSCSEVSLGDDNEVITIK